MVAAAGTTTPVFDGTDATEAMLNTDYAVAAGEHIYKIRTASLRSARMVPELTIFNRGTAQAAITAEVAFEAKPYSVITRTMSMETEAVATKVLAANMLDGINAEYIYVRLTTNQPLTFSGRLRNIHEGEACKTSIDFRWDASHSQSANTTAWYAIDIRNAKANHQDILLHLSNAGAEKATLRGSIAFACPYTDVQTITRTVAAQTTMNKTLSWNLFGMMAADTVYVGIETDQDIVFRAEQTDMPTKDPDEACLTATLFDYTYGHKQAANEAVWYKVALASVRNTDLLPAITIDNLGSAAAQIAAEMSLECPDNVANTTRTLTIAANGKYEKTVGRDLIDGIDQSIDTLYFRVLSSQPIAFRVNFIRENEGADCRSAILFNMVSGNDVAAGDNLWYMVDLRAAKAENRDLRVSISNKAKTSAQVEAQVAFSCPCDVPQTQTTTLAALQTKTTTIAHSTLETLGDTVYVRLSSTQTLHIEAEAVVPAPFTPIDCPETTVAFEWGQRYTTTQDTTWYYVSKEVLSALTQSTKAPRIFLSADEAQTVTAYLAYHCPVTSAMQSKSVKVAAGQQLYKLIERSTAEQWVAAHDTIMLQLIGRGLHFQVDLVDPNTGADCLHAINYEMTQSLTQEEMTTRWYRLSKNALVALDKYITFSIANAGTQAGRLQAELYTDCESEPIMAQAATLAAGQVRSKEVSSDIFSAFATDYLYMKITTEAGLTARISSSLRDFEEITPITACEEATETVLNTTYTVAAGTSEWFVVDIRNLQQNTRGNGTLTVTNLGGIPASAKAEISWVCPVRHEMTARTQVIPANGANTYTVERAQFEAFDSARVYVRLTTDQDITFRFDIELSKGDDCLNAIDFDWTNGNVHAGSDADGKTNCLWYQVRLDSTTIPEGYDMRLYISNLDQQHAAQTSARIMLECNQEVKSLERTLAAGETIAQAIDRDVIQQMGWPNLQILYCSDRNTKIYAGFEPEAERIKGYDTIRTTICDGASYEDTLFIGDQAYYISTFVSSDDAASLKLDTTISWREGTIMRDSVITYLFTPLKAATPLAPQQLMVMGARPVLIQGMYPEVDKSAEFLKNYYNASGLFAEIHTLYWATDAQGKDRVNTEVILPKGTRTVSLYLHIEDACDNSLNYPYTFMPEAWRTDSIVRRDTICPSTESKWLPDVIIAQDTTIRQTKECTITLADGRMRTIDSLFVYTILVKKEPVSVTTLPYEPTVACGKAINTTRATNLIKGQLDQERGELDMAVTAIVWQRKDMQTGAYSDLTADRLGKNEQTVVLRYAAITDCGTSVYSQDFTFVPEAYTYKVAEPVVATVCEGNEFVGRNGAHIILTDMAWNDTVTIHDTDMDYDSVYVYDVKAQIAVDMPEETVYIHEGETYTWRGKTLTELGTYGDTLRYDVTGCDSIRYTLHLDLSTRVHDATLTSVQLLPTMVQPGEEIRINNLDPAVVTEIIVYSSTGQKVAFYQAREVETFVLNAAQTTGCYMVELRTEKGHTTLRYMVK